MDTYTAKHLERWLESKFNEEDRDQARTKMVRLWKSDPEYWTKKGWSEVALESGAWWRD